MSARPVSGNISRQRPLLIQRGHGCEDDVIPVDLEETPRRHTGVAAARTIGAQHRLGRTEAGKAGQLPVG